MKTNKLRIPRKKKKLYKKQLHIIKWILMGDAKYLRYKGIRLWAEKRTDLSPKKFKLVVK